MFNGANFPLQSVVDPTLTRCLICMNLSMHHVLEQCYLGHKASNITPPPLHGQATVSQNLVLIFTR